MLGNAQTFPVRTPLSGLSLQDPAPLSPLQCRPGHTAASHAEPSALGLAHLPPAQAGVSFTHPSAFPTCSSLLINNLTFPSFLFLKTQSSLI